MVQLIHAEHGPLHKQARPKDHRGTCHAREGQANAYFDAYDTSWANANAIVIVEGKKKDISGIAKTVINELAVKAVNGVTIDDGAKAELDRLAA